MAKGRDERIKSFFDKCFEEGLFRDFEPGELERTRELVEMFEIRKGWRIIEPGCGCGRMTRLLAEKAGPHGRIDAFELSPKMVEYCLKTDFPSRVFFHNVSVMDLALPSDFADAVICFNVWPHLLEPERFLDFVRDHVKPEGLLFIAHSCGRGFINDIHMNSSEQIIHKHILPGAEDLSALLFEHGWETQKMLDGEDIYFLKAVKSDLALKRRS